MRIYVDASTKNPGDGSKDYPFNTIQAAANIAKPGDEVLVSPGVYREYVNPINAGTEDARISYVSTEPLKAVITGAERIDFWENVEGNVWKVKVDNGLFGNYNPFTTLVSGDWFIATFIAHTGDVFLNDKSMYEVTSLDGVKNPTPSVKSWDRDFSVYTWYTEQEDDKTVIYANFQGKNPNKENVEISVRRNGFYPDKEGVNYITLSGFTVCKAACQWAPPTAYQEGMVGPHWSKGWIIEDCEIYEAKCSGISLGKYKQPNNDNKWLKWKYKDGTQTERDNICQAQIEGWTKENIGHHIVRRCNIHDCGQTGIVGHLGGVFSIIEDNHIHHINNKQNLAGAEIGGIKMHAAIDVIYRRNHIHHCTRGLWLDWQAQGTRVTQNVFHDNCLPQLKDGIKFDREMAEGLGLGEDIFIEVSHGPTLLDNNLLLSERSLKIPTQGCAFVHNLIAGSLTSVGRGTDNGSKTLKSARFTPYHVPHRTEVMGFMTFLHGDMRFYNNIFIQQKTNEDLLALCNDTSFQDEWDQFNMTAGTHLFSEYPTFEEWDKEFEGYCGMGSDPSDRYYMHLPVYSGGNVYLNGAKAWDKEKDSVIDNDNTAEFEVKWDGKELKLKTNLYDFVPEDAAGIICTKTLGMAFEPEQCFENPDGSPITFNEDYLGEHRGARTMAGPFAKAIKKFEI